MYVEQAIPEISPEEKLRQQRREARVRRRREHRRAKMILWCTVSTSILLLALMGYFYLQIQQVIGVNALHPAINGVACDSAEQNAYHIHVHITIYINGKQAPIPASIGIPSDHTCFYWMHTHTSDGIIHIEAPAQLHNLALDDFLTIWHVGFPQLNFPPQMTQNTGWKIFINGKPFTDTVTSPLNTEVPLSSHDVVTLAYGTHNPAPDTFYVFPPNLPK